jgi:putative ABC transport system substrate-binding protein
MTSAVTRLAAALLLLAAPLTAEAQPAGKSYRIGYLSSGSSTVTPHVIEAFRQGLRELGWVEGQNITIDYRFAEYRYDRLPDLAADLVALKVDLIVAPATPAATAAKKATGTIPIVMIGVGDPVGTGFVTSLARPGGNVTGSSYGVGLEINSKQLELLKEAMPGLINVAVLSNPSLPFHALDLKELEIAARALKVRLYVVGTRAPGEFTDAVSAATKERAGALIVLTDAVFFRNRAS